MNHLSRLEKRNGSRHSQTVAGRATKIKVRTTASAWPADSSIGLGVTSNPSKKNIPACASQA
jgi:hypothetical protein